MIYHDMIDVANKRFRGEFLSGGLLVKFCFEDQQKSGCVFLFPYSKYVELHCEQVVWIGVLDLFYSYENKVESKKKYT